MHCNTLPVPGVENKCARKSRSSLVSSIWYQAAARKSARAKTKVGVSSWKRFGIPSSNRPPDGAIFKFWKVFWQSKYCYNEWHYLKNKINLWNSINKFPFLSCSCIFKFSATTRWYLYLTLHWITSPLSLYRYVLYRNILKPTRLCKCRDDTEALHFMLSLAATILRVHNLISFGSIYQSADDDLPIRGLQECIQILSNGLLTRVHLKSWQCHLTLLKEYVKRRYRRNTDNQTMPS